MVALLVEPAQLWLGLTRRRLRLHRGLGTAYMAGVAVGSVAAFYPLFHTGLGWGFGMGLVGLAVASRGLPPGDSAQPIAQAF